MKSEVKKVFRGEKWKIFVLKLGVNRKAKVKVLVGESMGYIG